MEVLTSVADRYGLVIATTVLVLLPLGVLAGVVVARARIARGWPTPWARRSAAAEVGMVIGTAPWVWMIMTPADGAGGVRLIPFRDLGAVLTGGDAIVQVMGNLLVFAALGALLPVRFRLGRPWTVVPLVFLVAAASSTVLEVLQLVLALGRVTSVDDVLLNASGAAAASLLTVAGWRSRSPAPPPACSVRGGVAAEDEAGGAEEPGGRVMEGYSQSWRDPRATRAGGPRPAKESRRRQG